MGLLIPAPRFFAQEASYSGRPTTTWGTALTASGTPHALPASPTEIIASTAQEYDRIVIEVSEMSTSATVTDGLVNIYTGAGGSEVIFIDSLLAGWTQTQGSTGPGFTYDFPVRIPKGTRISASLRALIASDTCRVRIQLYQTGGWCGQGVETIGQLTATSRGTQITPGTTSDGTFTTLGTTVYTWKYVVCYQIGSADTTVNVGVIATDLGTGSALIPGLENFHTTNTSGEIMVPHQADGRWVNVPAGTALQARCQSSTTDTEAKSVIAYGVY